jgi:N-acetylglucosamine-6-sulfatase
MKGRHVLGLSAALATIALTVAVAFAGSGGAAQAAPQQAQPERPNVLILETDDQTLAEMDVLPNVRRLIGAEGVTFDNNFDSFSLCCPSRASLLTGQYSHNNGVRGNALPQGGYYKLDSTNTLAVWLQKAGYYTMHVGKYLNGYGTRDPREIPPGWSDWHGSVDPTTYRYYNYTLNENGQLNTYCAKPEASCYQTDVYRDKANGLIQARAGQGPWFMWVAFLADHSGGPREADDPRGQNTPVPAPRYKNRLQGTPMPQPPNFNEADVSDKPRTIRNRPLLNQRQIAAVQENWQQRRETLLAVDDAVASIVETLRTSGQLDNTLILFTSDNGFFHGEHRVRAGKVLLYEPSIRVPLLMRWTGNRSLPRGVHRTQLSMNVDYAETILGAVGESVRPERVEDGVNLLRFWRDSGLELGRDLLIDNMPGTAHFDAVRSRNYLYAEWANGERELYDLRRDPYELASQHANPAYDAVKASLATRLHRLVSCAGGTCRTAPAVGMSLRRSGCSVRATVTGPGAVSVGFWVNGRRVATDSRRPFRVAVVRRGLVSVRARVSFAGDRLVTADRRVRSCG